MTPERDELDAAIDVLRKVASAKRERAAHHQACAVKATDHYAKSYRLAANYCHTEAAELDDAVEVLEREKERVAS